MYNFDQYDQYVNMIDTLPAYTRISLVVIFILLLISRWMLFKKANVPGWYAIVPILSTWTYIKIANSFRTPLLTFIFLLIPGVNVFIFYMLQYRFASRFTDRFGLRLLYFIFPFIGGLIFAFGDEFQYKKDPRLNMTL